MIKFNIPKTNKFAEKYILDTLNRNKLCGDGFYTQKCISFFKEKLLIDHSLLTTSCTDALEMSALLLNIREGDEVILPSYTFVSTANAFLLRGAKLKFVDSTEENPNICPKAIKNAITSKTKAIVIVHYAGVSCDMDEIMRIANGIPVVEDAAQAIDSYYKGQLLGTFGKLGTYSFHETKNITSGEGGLLIVNDKNMVERAEIIREKGTNRNKFIKGEVDKYGWVDIGSSFLPSELNAALLYSQLQDLHEIQHKRKSIWNKYNSSLSSHKLFETPIIPEYSEHNAHMFYIVCQNRLERDSLIEFAKLQGVQLTFHYSSLHKSTFFESDNIVNECVNSDKFSNRLVRLPLHLGLKEADIDKVIITILQYYIKMI